MKAHAASGICPWIALRSLFANLQASFPTHGSATLHLFSHTCSHREKYHRTCTASANHSYTALMPLILLHIAKQSRHYLPEVTPWTILHGQERNIINQEVHLLGNFTGSHYIGMVQPKHTESWMKTQLLFWKNETTYCQQITFYVWGFSVPQIYPCWGTHSSTGTYQYPNA